jgi:hypothetical protein
MPRWTSDLIDIQKIAGLIGFLDEWGFKKASVELEGGARIDGIILPGRVGNNAGEGGRWSYYGCIVVRMDDADVEVDYLDVVGAHLL